MFGDVFETEEDLVSGNNYGAVQTSAQRRPKNCAGLLDLPEQTRLKYQNQLEQETNATNNKMEEEKQSQDNPNQLLKKQFAGIKNQGATCYLNSLIQSCFMSPEFRQSIYSIPLCKESLESRNDMVKNDKKFNILIAFQKLFAEMDMLDVRSVSTEELTKSFGWGDNQGLEQQDIQEAYRVIYDALERALSDTPLKNTFLQQYKGILVNHITCLKCGTAKEREEDFYDLILQVQGFFSVEESLRNLITPETLDQDNQYFCEKCDCKNDALKGQKIRVFPDVLTLSLNRFVFDLQTFTRVKIDSELKFGLELDISQFLEYQEQGGQEIKDDENNLYELQSVLIHRGNAHGGHYHAYIRDCMEEGEWDVLMKSFLEEQKKQKEKEKERKQKELDEQKNQEADNEESDNEKPIKKAEIEKIEEEDENEEDSDSDKQQKNQEVQQKENFIEDVQKDQQKENTNKNQKKNGKKQNQKQQQQGEKQKKGGPHPSGKNSKQRKKEKSVQKLEEKKKQVALDQASYDSQNFPIPFKNPKLAQNWYDFNDSSVSVIPVNRIQSQFGGNSESSYILIYRRKNIKQFVVNHNENNKEQQKTTQDHQNVIQMPEYLKKYIKAKNDVLIQERQNYADAEQHIEILFTQPNNLDFEKLKWNQDYDIEKEGLKLKFHVDTPAIQILQQVAQNYSVSNIEDLTLLEVEEKQLNKLNQFLKLIDYKNIGQKTIKELDISHFSNWIVFTQKDNDTNKLIENKIKPYMGEECIPIKLQVVVQGNKSQDIIAWSNMWLKDFRTILSNKFPEIKYEQQYIKEYQGNEQVNHLNSNPGKDFLTLSQLKIFNDHDLILQKIDPNIIIQQRELKKKKQQEQQNKNQNKSILKEENLVSILVETDDDSESHRLFIQLDQTLDQLLQHIKEKFNIKSGLKRRLRKLQYQTLFYENEYKMKLEEIEDFKEGGIRLQIERGGIPVSGNIVIKFINQSNQYKKESHQDITHIDQLIQEDVKDKKHEVIIDQKATALQLKTQICEQFGLNVQEHKLYKTDHLEEPYQAVNTNQEGHILKSLSLKTGDLVILRHISQLIGSEMKSFKVFITKTGLSDDSKLITDVKIAESSTLKQLKELIIKEAKKQILSQEEQLKEFNQQRLRIRTIKKDLFFGNILRKEDKTLKKYTFPTNQIVVQVLDQPEDLQDTDLCMILMKRDVANRQYINQQEFIFKASGPNPTLDDLYEQVVQFLNNDNQQQKISPENSKQTEKQEEQNTKIEQEFEQLSLQNIKLAKYFPYEYLYTELSQETMDQFNQNTKRKGKKQSKQDQIISIKKAPFLIKDDGDMIGYRLETENIDQLDDFQTNNDEYMMQQLKEKKKQNQIMNEARYQNKNGKETGVKIQSFDEEEEIALAIRQVQEFEQNQQSPPQQQ